MYKSPGCLPIAAAAAAATLRKSSCRILAECSAVGKHSVWKELEKEEESVVTGALRRRILTQSIKMSFLQLAESTGCRCGL